MDTKEPKSTTSSPGQDGDDRTSGRRPDQPEAHTASRLDAQRHNFIALLDTYVKSATVAARLQRSATGWSLTHVALRPKHAGHARAVGVVVDSRAFRADVGPGQCDLSLLASVHGLLGERFGRVAAVLVEPADPATVVAELTIAAMRLLDDPDIAEVCLVVTNPALTVLAREARRRDKGFSIAHVATVSAPALEAVADSVILMGGSKRRMHLR